MRATLLTRPGCGLCEEFLGELLEAFPQLAGGIALADVDSDPQWRRRYGHRIPVLLDESGEFLCAAPLDVEVVGAKLKRASRAAR
jgi:hypothetical protein